MRKPVVLTVLMFLLLLAVSMVFVSSFDLTITSSAQNANSPTTTNINRNQNNNTRSIGPPSGAGGQQQDFSQNTWELPDDADKTKNPTAATPESIAQGKELYVYSRQRQLHLLSRRNWFR